MPEVEHCLREVIVEMAEAQGMLISIKKH